MNRIHSFLKLGLSVVYKCILFGFLVGCALDDYGTQNSKKSGNSNNDGTQQDDGRSNTALLAFEDSVFQITRQDCVGCHGSGVGPQFAVSNSASAYEVTKRYVDFDDIDGSRIVERIQDGHCGRACNTDGQDLIDAIEYWFQEGESGETASSGSLRDGGTLDDNPFDL